ncbi:MAG: hypothetical protein C0508_25155, partial [Cyanobacteria bacterium PR.023]|nr:hypothetical protein [Cyanobacteria bacterium PR.023]
YLEQAANLTFVDDRCIASRVLTLDEDLDFQHWRAEQIVSWSRGKAVPEILKEFGSSGLYAYSKGSALLPASEPVLETLGYSTGSSTSASLTIKHGVCTESSLGIIAY